MSAILTLPEQTRQLQNLKKPRNHFYKYTTVFPFHLQIGPGLDLLLNDCVVVQIFDLDTSLQQILTLVSKLNIEYYNKNKCPPPVNQNPQYKVWSKIFISQI